MPDVVVGDNRPVTVHVPSSYDPAKPAPLLIVLHGYGSSGREHEAYFHLDAAADQRGYLIAYPDGIADTTGSRFWSATDACCDFDRTGVNDVAYLTGVITGIQASFAVDPKRIDLVGHSNGGFMSYRMACTHPELVAAIVSLAGATFGNPADCAPSAPVAVLQIHGTADDVIAYGGGTIQGIGSGRLMSALSRRRRDRRHLGALRRLRSRACRRQRARGRRRGPERRRLARRGHGETLDRLCARRGCRALDDAERRPRPDDLGRVPGRGLRLPRGASAPVGPSGLDDVRRSVSGGGSPPSSGHGAPSSRASVSPGSTSSTRAMLLNGAPRRSSGGRRDPSSGS